MARSAETTLFGVQNYRDPSDHLPGFPHRWAELRAPGAWGFMKDDNHAPIVWFNDFGAREDFHKIFGGQRVTLQRKVETLQNEKARQFLRAASNKTGSVG